MNINKTLGTPLCAILGADVVSGIYSWALTAFGVFNTIVYSIGWSIINLATVFGAFYIASKKDVFVNSNGRFAAFGIGLLYCIFIINHIISAFGNFNIFSSFGSYASLILGVIVAIVMIAFLFISKAWIYIKIFGTIVYIPKLISDYLIVKVTNDSSNFEVLERIWSYIIICACFTLAFELSALILTIIWMNKKPKAASFNKNPIDLI